MTGNRENSTGGIDSTDTDAGGTAAEGEVDTGTGDEATEGVNRRRFLAGAALAATTGLAGCSVSTPAGDFSVSQDTETDTPTPSPTPVSTVRPTATSTATPTATSTATPTPTPVEELDVEAETVTPAASVDEVPPCVTNGTCVTNEDIVVTPVGTGDWVRPSLDANVTASVGVGGDVGGVGGVDGGGTGGDGSGNESVGDVPIYTVEPVTLPEGDAPTATTQEGAVTVTVTPNEEGTERTKEGEAEEEIRDRTVCTTQRRSMRKGGGSTFLLNPNLTEIWPGAILRARSIATGEYTPALTSERRDGTPISEARQPLELSISLMNVDSSTVTVETPGQGAVRAARRQVLEGVNEGATPAQMEYEMHQVHSEESLDVALGAHYDGAAVDVSNDFDFSRESETNKLLVKFLQRYYTLDVSLPNPLGDGLVTGDYLEPNDVVVDGVSYGRLLLFSMESNYSRKAMSNAFDAAYDGLARDASASVDVTKEEVMRNSKVSVDVLGGSAESAAGLISDYGDDALGAIQSFIERGANYQPSESPGVPVAYSTKYANGLQTANVYLSTTYTARNCRPATGRYEVTNFRLHVPEANDVIGGKNKEEIYGDIYVVGIAQTDDGERAKLVPDEGSANGRVWSRAANQFVRIEEQGSAALDAEATLSFPPASMLDQGTTIEDLDHRNSVIKVTALPREADNGPDDFENAKDQVVWSLAEPPSQQESIASEEESTGTEITQEGEFGMTFRDKGTEIRLSFDIRPLPPV